MSLVVLSLYRFAALEDYRALREPLLDLCLARGVRGTLLLAAEGINGTIAGERNDIDAVLHYLGQHPQLSGLHGREASAEQMPFKRMKVKLKREIVTMGVPWVDPRRAVGTYVAPVDWNALVQDPEVLLIDARNHYEYGVGTFKGAVDPNTRNFREFPHWAAQHLDPSKHRRVAMFCTGGIRCEKASAYLLQQGFEQVYHLQGGVLAYLEQVPAAQSTWQGECFVFDERVTVDHALRPGSYGQCHGCRHPVSTAEQQSPLYEPGISCPHCHHTLSEEQRARFAERRRQAALARERAAVHCDAAADQRSARKRSAKRATGT